MAFRRLNPNQTMTQTILDHLVRVGNLSSLEAQGMYKCRSLSRRICDIKAKGHKIVAVQKTDATGQRYVRYVYLGAANQMSQGSHTLPRFITHGASR
jgi:hypothetical protein